jgi:outer membrane protein TolC
MRSYNRNICSFLLSLVTLGSATASFAVDAPESIKPTADSVLDVVHLAANKIPNVGKIKLGTLQTVGPLKPIRLEASYNESINLEGALNYALENNLPIRVTQQSSRYQHYQVFEALGSALPIPSVALFYGQTAQNIVTSQANVLAAIYQPTILLPLFQGGAQVYNLLGQCNRSKGWRQSLYASINDTLLDVDQKYENLVYQRTLLQISARAVENYERLLQLNVEVGKTHPDAQYGVMQARTQLGIKKHALADQQLNYRLAALALAHAMNAPLAGNLVPRESGISEKSIIDENTPISSLLNVALTHRPELRQFEYFKLAANRNIPVAAATLYPNASLYGQYTYSETNEHQNPLALEQEAVIALNSGDGGGAGSATAGAGVFGGLFQTTQGGYGVTWEFAYCGIPVISNVAGVTALARQTGLQANQQLQVVRQQLRSDYATAITSRAQIDNAAFGLAAGRESLPVAEQNLLEGSVSNFQVIQVEESYFNLLALQAQSIYLSNVSQAKILHDIGAISVKTLTKGYAITDELPAHPTPRKDI